MQKQQIKRPRLNDDIIQIGTAFNIITEQFLTTNVYRKLSLDWHPEKNSKGIKKFLNNQSIEDKFKDPKFQQNSLVFIRTGIGMELQLKMMNFPLQIQGACSYYKWKKKFRHSICYDVEYRYVLGQVKVNEEKSQVDPEVLKQAQKMGATHIVVQITRGGRCYVNYEEEVKELAERVAQRANIEMNLKSDLQLTASAESKFGLEQKNLGKTGKMRLRFCGDIKPPPGTKWNTVLEYFETMDQIVKAQNDGKGSVIEYTLLPLSEFSSQVQDHMYFDLSAKTIQEIQTANNNLTRCLQLINQSNHIQNIMGNFKDHFIKERLNELENNCKIQQSIFQDHITRGMIIFKKQGDSSIIQDAIQRLMLVQESQDESIDSDESEDDCEFNGFNPHIMLKPKTGPTQADTLYDINRQVIERFQTYEFLKTHNVEILSIQSKSQLDMQFSLQSLSFMVVYLYNSRHLNEKEFEKFKEYAERINILDVSTSKCFVVNLQDSLDFSLQDKNYEIDRNYTMQIDKPKQQSNQNSKSKPIEEEFYPKPGSKIEKIYRDFEKYFIEPEKYREIFPMEGESSKSSVSQSMIILSDARIDIIDENDTKCKFRDDVGEIKGALMMTMPFGFDRSQWSPSTVRNLTEANKQRQNQLEDELQNKLQEINGFFYKEIRRVDMNEKQEIFLIYDQFEEDQSEDEQMNIDKEIITGQERIQKGKFQKELTEQEKTQQEFQDQEQEQKIEEQIKACKVHHKSLRKKLKEKLNQDLKKIQEDYKGRMQKEQYFPIAEYFQREPFFYYQRWKMENESVARITSNGYLQAYDEFYDFKNVKFIFCSPFGEISMEMKKDDIQKALSYQSDNIVFR